MLEGCAAGRLRHCANKEAGGGVALFRAGRVRLARRHQPPGRNFRSYRFRQPCRLRHPIEPQQPGSQITVAPLQGLQQRFLGGID